MIRMSAKSHLEKGVATPSSLSFLPIIQHILLIIQTILIF